MLPTLTGCRRRRRRWRNWRDAAHFVLFSSCLFALIAVVHALRLVYGWRVTLGEWAVPVWVSCSWGEGTGGRAAGAGAEKRRSVNQSLYPVYAHRFAD